MKIYRNGEYFAQGESLEDIAQIAGEDVSRYSFGLEDLRVRKEEEIDAKVMEELTPLFAPGRGREESISLIAAHVEAICKALSIPVDPRLMSVSAAGKKAQSKKQAIKTAKSEDDLDGVSWP